MTARLLPGDRDRIRPQPTGSVTITLDGEQVTGIAGQSIAGILMAHGQLELRRTSQSGSPRGVFCGIGVCFDCLVQVNGVSDVRGCQRIANERDVVVTREHPDHDGDAA